MLLNFEIFFNLFETTQRITSKQIKEKSQASLNVKLKSLWIKDANSIHNASTTTNLGPNKNVFLALQLTPLSLIVDIVPNIIYFKGLSPIEEI